MAAQCGYADQGHLARDWSELAGCPPSTWLREEFPFLQDHEAPTGQAEAMTAADTKLWHSMAFADADRMIAWLTAIGFTEHATYRDETDPSVVVHAEWLWPGGGGIMFGSRRPDGAIDNVGGSAAYLVTDDPDGVFERAVAAGATVERDDGRPGLRRPRRQRRRSRGQPLVVRGLPAPVAPYPSPVVGAERPGRAGASALRDRLPTP